MTYEEKWIIDKPTIVPLTLNRARIVVPNGEYSYGDGW